MNNAFLRCATTFGWIASACLFIPTAFAAAERDSGSVVEEIIVSATYRDTRLMDTPLTLSAITSEEIFAKGMLDVLDFHKSVPGLSYQAQVAAFNILTIRGLSPPGGGAATVGVYLDNLPMTDPTGGGRRQAVGELFDLERVEVLKGPQGTLYGEGSMGGSIRYITTKPDPSGFDYAVQGRVDGNAESSGLSYVVDGMVNIPLGERLALRLVGFQRDREGLLDQVAPSSRKDVNWFEQKGGRAMLGWDVTDTLRVTAMMNASYSDMGGPHMAYHCNSEATLNNPLGRPPTYPLPGTTCATTTDAVFKSSNPYVTHFAHRDAVSGGMDDLEMFNLTIDWELPFATLTASSSYMERESSAAEEGSILSALAFRGVADLLIPGILQNIVSDQSTYRYGERWANEIRLVSNSDSRLQWTAGLYIKDDEQQDSRVSGSCLRGGPPVNATLPDSPCWFQYLFVEGTPFAEQAAVITFVDTIFAGFVPTNHTKITEQSVFGEVSYQFNDQWELLLGARYAQVEFALGSSQPGTDSPSNLVNEQKTKTNVFSPKATLTWRPNDDWMIYGTVSHGFRPGIVNRGLVGVIAQLDAIRAGSPIAEGHYQRLVDLQSLDSDEVQNFELGVKAAVADGRVSFTGALYHIDWKNAVVSATETIDDVPGFLPLNFGYVVDNGEAESQGLELEVTAALTDAVSLSVGGDWNWSAKILTAGDGRYSGSGFEPGNRLENAPETSAFASLTWDFTMAGLNATARLDGYYSGDEKYFSIINDEITPSSHSFDLKLLFGRDNWQGSIFVNNVTDEVIAYELNTTGYSLAPPRVIGMQFSLRM